MTAPLVDGRVHVRVPATSANLGPGFDALGLGLALYDDLWAQVGGDSLRVEVVGEGRADVLRDESHLVVRAMRTAFAELGARPAGLTLHCRNEIPHGRGLGSSAAAIVAGLLLGRALVAGGTALLSDAGVLALATRIEGHPDNVASCLLGGLTIAWTAGDGTARAVRRDPDPQVVPVALIAPFVASTAITRGLLPVAVPHVDAAFVAGRAALLVAALTGAPHALFDATEDRLHQDYRAPAMPQSAALVHRLRADGLPAVISGAGPTVLVLARSDQEAEQALAAVPDGWRSRRLRIDLSGAVVRGARLADRVEPEPPDVAEHGATV